jgi:hypothetical protein
MGIAEELGPSRVPFGLHGAVGALCLALCAGCVTAPESTPLPRGDYLTATPSLSQYTAYDLRPTAAQPGREPEARGAALYDEPSQTLILSSDADDHGARFVVQPVQCRDDPDPACIRRFAITGVIHAFGTTLHCYVPIRNDTQAGYRGQALTGVCQNPYGVSFTLNLVTDRR